MKAEQGQFEGKTENGQLEIKSARDATVRVLPADVYDTLELSAYAYDGIGGGWFTETGPGLGDAPTDVPLCAYGHARAAEGYNGVIADALRRALIGGNQNDSAVSRVNERHGARPYARVPFAEWCAELGIVRGKS